MKKSFCIRFSKSNNLDFFNFIEMKKSLLILSLWLIACPSWMIGQERMYRHEVRLSQDAIYAGHYLTLSYGITKGRNTFEAGPRFLLNRPIEDRVYYVFRNRMKSYRFDEHFGLYFGYARSLFKNPALQVNALTCFHASYSRAFTEYKVVLGSTNDPSGNLQPIYYDFGIWTERLPHAEQSLGLEIKLRIWRELWLNQRASGAFAMTYNKVEHKVDWQPNTITLAGETWVWSIAYQLGVGLSYRW